METGTTGTSVKASSLRWKILRQAILRKPNDEQSEIGVKRITRKTKQGFNLLPCHLVDDPSHSSDVTVCYTLPIDSAPKLYLTQRVVDHAELRDFEICNKYNIDNTGLVCQWPSEEVLAYFCLSHADMFRSKRVIELGSGYGLAGLVIAAVTEASEVVISDGNPQVVDYIQHNIDANSKAFGGTRVKSMMLHWNQNEISNISSTFDLIVASDWYVPFAFKFPFEQFVHFPFPLKEGRDYALVTTKHVASGMDFPMISSFYHKDREFGLS
ncbi:unnamed protein product [Prunus armeniaca]